MATVASQPPVGFTSGLSTDQNFQPLNECGSPNPFFYASFDDDFLHYNTGDYTVTATGTGAAVAGVAGDGGLLQFTAGTTAGNASIQTHFANYTVNSQPKKVFFLTRVTMSAWATTGVTALWGLIQTTATPGTVTDGVYFSLSAAGALSINSTVGSTVTSVAIPTAAYTLTGGTYIDLGFAITRQGDVLAYVDTQLVGNVPQSNIGTNGNPKNAGAVARITAPTLTTAVLNPTLAVIQTGTTSVTMTSDFFLVKKER